MKKMMAVIAVLGLALVLYGCGEDATSTSGDAKTQATAAALPAELIVAAPPEGAKDVAEAKAAAKAGEPIVIRGKIGGTENPLAVNRAMMTILDPSVTTCDKMEGDHCPTPWDACCEPANVVAAKSATVQVVGEDGKPLSGTLKGVSGIEPLKEVVVSGVARPAGDALVVEAKQIYVKP